LLDVCYYPSFLLRNRRRAAEPDSAGEVVGGGSWLAELHDSQDHVFTSPNWPVGHSSALIHYLLYKNVSSLHDKQSLAVRPSQVKHASSQGMHIFVSGSPIYIGGHTDRHVLSFS
jgi:hypothetical protein